MFQIVFCIHPYALMLPYFLKSIQLLEIFGAILIFSVLCTFVTLLQTVYLSFRNKLQLIPEMFEIVLGIHPYALMLLYFLKSIQLLEIFGAILIFSVISTFVTLLQTVYLSFRNKLQLIPDMFEIVLGIHLYALMLLYFLKSIQLLEIFVRF